ncbi:uncharacterized protein LOC142330252 isoform X1 [Lycorma delicatula]|uniref:uncharacterized protein LOC142330252 isoform X1 n=1 Tax=Lycorma delicatula TaxID=130591 RepID=UPI003F5142A4
MDVPLKNIYIFEALSSNSIKLKTEDDTAEETLCLFLPHHPIEDDITSDCDSDSFQVKEEPLGNGCDNYNEVTDPLAFEGIKLIKSEDHAIKNEVESEILLNDDVASQPNLNMRTNEQINDLRPMKIEEEIWFYPGHVAMDKGTIKGSTKNFITYKSINNSLNDGIINENSIECNCAYGDVTIENLIENISSENKLFEQKGKELVCEYCNERFRCNCYLKRHINIHTKQKKIVTFVKSHLILKMF